MKEDQPNEATSADGDVAHGPDGRVDCDELLVHTERRLREGEDVKAAIYSLCDDLGRVRRGVSPEFWEEYCRRARRGALFEMLMEDPYTRRGFEKPRGYAGDATLLDYLYGTPGFEQPRDGVTELGRKLWNVTTRGPGSCALVSRRDRLAQLLGEEVERRSEPAVLSVACGHARELTICDRAVVAKLGSFVGLDQDAEALGALDGYAKWCPVRPVHLSVAELLGARVTVGHFDLIYSTGLCDYLSDRFIGRLVRHLFTMLRPGGRMVLANVMPSIMECGYMEAFMDWRLVYREQRHGRIWRRVRGVAGNEQGPH